MFKSYYKMYCMNAWTHYAVITSITLFNIIYDNNNGASKQIAAKAGCEEVTPDNVWDHFVTAVSPAFKSGNLMMFQVERLEAVMLVSFLLKVYSRHKHQIRTCQRYICMSPVLNKIIAINYSSLAVLLQE